MILVFSVHNDVLNIVVVVMYGFIQTYIIYSRSLTQWFIIENPVRYTGLSFCAERALSMDASGVVII